MMRYDAMRAILPPHDYDRFCKVISLACESDTDVMRLELAFILPGLTGAKALLEEWRREGKAGEPLYRILAANARERNAK